MKTVRMIHPEVGGTEVPESAVPHWRASGWQVAEEAPAESEVNKPLDDQGEQAPPKRRRAKEGE